MFSGETGPYPGWVLPKLVKEMYVTVPATHHTLTLTGDLIAALERLRVDTDVGASLNMSISHEEKSGKEL